MNPLTREEFIELGMSFSPGPMIQWAEQQLAAARRHEEEFHSRGMDAARFSGTEDLIKKVRAQWNESGYIDDLPPEYSAQNHRIRGDAQAFKKEVSLIAKAAFGAQPEVLSTFRPGVPTGQLLANLANELKSVVGLLREHAPRLGELGATPEFTEKGEHLIALLEKAMETQNTAMGSLPPTVAQKYHDTGLLYDLIRTLVRIGRLEFMNDPDMAAAFTFRGSSLSRGASGKAGSKGHRVANR